MSSSLFYRLLKDNTSTEPKRSNFIKKLGLSRTRSVLVTKLRLAVDIDDVKDYFKQNFGEVEEVTFHHTKRNDYTKCVIVKMKTYESVKKILAEETHEILGHRVCVEPHSGSTQIKKPPFIKGRYKVKLTGLDTRLSDVQLNSLIEEAFAGLGHHTGIELWKEYATGKPEGTAEIRFINKEDGLQAVEIAFEQQWDAELWGPRNHNDEN